MTFLSRTRSLSSVTLAAVLLAACGPPAPEKKSEAPAQSAAPSPPVADAHAGGALIVNGAPVDIDPAARTALRSAEAAEEEIQSRLRADTQRAREALRQLQAAEEQARRQDAMLQIEAAKVRAIQEQTRAIEAYNATLRQQAWENEQRARQEAAQAELLQRRRQVIFFQNFEGTWPQREDQPRHRRGQGDGKRRDHNDGSHRDYSPGNPGPPRATWRTDPPVPLPNAFTPPLYPTPAPPPSVIPVLTPPAPPPPVAPDFTPPAPPASLIAQPSFSAPVTQPAPSSEQLWARRGGRRHQSQKD